MRLICPSCGAVHSADAWQNDADARQTLALTLALPHLVARRMLGYLALFRRPGGKALRWGTALKVTQDLSEMVSSGQVQVDRLPTAHAAPALWAMGMERMMAHESLRRPLENNNYLRKVVYDLATAEAAGRPHGPPASAGSGSGSTPTPRPPFQGGQGPTLPAVRNCDLPEGHPDKVSSAAMAALKDRIKKSFQ